MSNFVWNGYKIYKQTGNWLSHGGFSIYDSQFEESCFERDLKLVLYLVCTCSAISF